MSAYSTYSDEQLIALLKTGGEKIFDEVFHRYNPRLFPHVLKMVRSRELAEEIIQDVFTRLWNNKAEIAQMENPTAWLFTVALNLSLDHLRKAATQKRILDHIRQQTSLYPATSNDPIADKENERILTLAIDQLSPKKREIFRMSRQQGMSHAEIAERLNISSSTVNNHLVAALEYLRTNMKKAGILMSLFYFF